MSVLIRGMEMPKSCSECFMKFCDGRKTVVHFTVERSDNCPLVEVPPHGRLIDADALEDRCSRQAKDEWNKSTGTNWGYAYATFESDVEDAPTIIPACEEVYDKYTDTAGNLHWTGTHSGKHIIPANEGKKKGDVEQSQANGK